MGRSNIFKGPSREFPGAVNGRDHMPPIIQNLEPACWKSIHRAVKIGNKMALGSVKSNSQIKKLTLRLAKKNQGLFSFSWKMSI
jgi:hypothetical protein